MDIIVRNYENNDLEQVNVILQEAFQCEKKNFSGDNFTEVVATIDDKVVGYLLLTRVFNPVLDKLYILVDYVCVLSAYRDAGIGQKMLEYADSIAKSEKAIYLQLTCSYFRVAAHRLYEKCGYVRRDSDIFRKDLV